MTVSPAVPIKQRTLQREATRRQLLEAGLRVVAESGFAGASTAAIAQATGKAHGTVFVHFRTRDELVGAIVAEVGRTMSEALAALDGAELPSISDVLDAHLTALGNHELLYSRLLAEASTLPLAARAQVFALQSGVGWRLRGAYERSRAQRLVRDLDPVTLTNLWIALINHYLLNRDLFAPGASVVEQHGAALKKQLLSLIELPSMKEN